MSRGLGKTQLAIIDALSRQKALSVWSLADIVYGGRPTQSNLVAVRRGLQRLEEMEIVFTDGKTHPEKRPHRKSLGDDIVHTQIVYRWQLMKRKSK